MPDLPATPFDDLDAWAVLRPQDIAERLRVDARSVRRAIASGALPASRACGLRVLAADAAAWWRAGSVAPELEPPEAPASEAPPRHVAEAPRRRPSRRFQRAASTERLPLPPRGGAG
jgi:hypothetical protein